MRRNGQDPSILLPPILLVFLKTADDSFQPSEGHTQRRALDFSAVDVRLPLISSAHGTCYQVIDVDPFSRDKGLATDCPSLCMSLL